MPSSLQRIYAPASRRPSWTSTLLRLALLILAAWLIWGNAWISDDAVITLRTVLNLLTGHGARFNIDERVQAYTHPLWFGLLTLGTALTGNAFLATTWLGIALSVAVVGWLLWLAESPWQGLLAAGALLASMAFIEFSTSGLENPLSHLLILAAATALIRIHDVHTDPLRQARWLRGFFLCAGLLYLSRPDLVLLLAPCALQLLLSTRSIAVHTRIRALLWAAVPVLIWTAFSLLYYGFPFPNTAYAKLGTGITQHALWRQGWHYFGNMRADPITLAVSALAVLLAPWVRRWGWSWALGVALYLIYVASIGGDFMAGRFFTAPMLAGAIALARVRLPLSRTALLLTLGLLTLAVPGLAWKNIHTNVRTAYTHKLPAKDVLDRYLIADERSFHFDYNSLAIITTAPKLATYLAQFHPNNYGAHHTPRSIGITCGGLGLLSILGGQDQHIIDPCGLADPLLARLPIDLKHLPLDQMMGMPNRPNEPNWRIGHFERAMPAGYADSIQQDANLLTDPTLHACYERIRRITRAPLLDSQRLRDIVHVNLVGTGCRAP